jgi:hypothetical protein
MRYLGRPLLYAQKALEFSFFDPGCACFGAVALIYNVDVRTSNSEIALVECGGSMMVFMGSRHKLYGHGFNHQTIQHVGTSTTACVEEA